MWGEIKDREESRGFICHLVSSENIYATVFYSFWANECVQMRFICERACAYVCACVYPTPEHELYFVFATLLV